MSVDAAQLLFRRLATLALLGAGATNAGPLTVHSLNLADCFLANPDAFEVMTGWVTTSPEQNCLLALPNKGGVKHPTISIDGHRRPLVSVETTTLHSATPGAWQKLVRMKTRDGAVQVELRYRVAEDECNPESSCYPPKYGELSVTRGVERHVVSVQQIR
jgi:hypothetical protein